MIENPEEIEYRKDMLEEGVGAMGLFISPGREMPGIEILEPGRFPDLRGREYGLRRGPLLTECLETDIGGIDHLADKLSVNQGIQRALPVLTHRT